jgi:hypothetical protein
MDEARHQAGGLPDRCMGRVQPGRAHHVGQRHGCLDRGHPPPLQRQAIALADSLPVAGVTPPFILFFLSPSHAANLSSRFAAGIKMASCHRGVSLPRCTRASCRWTAWYAVVPWPRRSGSVAITFSEEVQPQTFIIINKTEKKKIALRGARTHDHTIKSRALYRLS